MHPIKWSRTAVYELECIQYYFSSIGNTSSGIKIIEEIIQLIDGLEYFPFKHPIDSVLGEPFRCIVFKNYKIIYFPDQQDIKILRIFDTRQNPLKLKV